MTTILNSTEKTENTGRLTTFTFGDVKASNVRALHRELGMSCDLSDPSPRTALREAAEQFAYRWNAVADTRFARVFARRMSANRVELVEELLTDASVTERRTVAVATCEGVETDRADVAACWDKVYAYYCEHVTSSTFGVWAENFVISAFYALPLANRGHSLHVTSKRARAFDTWLDGMRKICDVQAISFATMDTDPASIAALVASMRDMIEKSIDAARAALARDTLTARGRDAAVERLRDSRDRLRAYHDLAGAEVDALRGSVAQAEAELMLAQF